MVQIVEFMQNKKKKQNVKPVFDPVIPSKIMERKECRDLDFLVLSIVGPKRTGKSFLINIMIHYLNSLQVRVILNSNNYYRVQLKTKLKDKDAFAHTNIHSDNFTWVFTVKVKSDVTR